MLDFLYYVLISLLIFSIISKTSYKLNLLDKPNHRKKHFKPTAYTGGLALSLIYIFSIFFFDIANNKLNLILSIALFVALVGFLDDKISLNIGGKLSLQIIPIFYLIIYENLYLVELGSYGYFNLQLASFSIPFTLLSVMYLINSFNNFDGLDGTLSFTTISVLAILYFLVPNTDVRLFITNVALPLIIFLLFNFSIFKLPKLFLGDSGSLLLGFIIAFLVIFIANQKLAHPILIAWSISIFVYEFLSINLLRLKKKGNIFKSGLDHLHHIIHRKTKSIFLTNSIISSLNLIFFVVGYLSFIYINPLISFVLFIIFFSIFIILRIKYLS